MQYHFVFIHGHVVAFQKCSQRLIAACQMEPQWRRSPSVRCVENRFPVAIEFRCWISWYRNWLRGKRNRMRPAAIIGWGGLALANRNNVILWRKNGVQTVQSLPFLHGWRIICFAFRFGRSLQLRHSSWLLCAVAGKGLYPSESLGDLFGEGEDSYCKRVKGTFYLCNAWWRRIMPFFHWCSKRGCCASNKEEVSSTIFVYTTDARMWTFLYEWVVLMRVSLHKWSKVFNVLTTRTY